MINFPFLELENVHVNSNIALLGGYKSFISYANADQPLGPRKYVWPLATHKLITALSFRWKKFESILLERFESRYQKPRKWSNVTK